MPIYPDADDDNADWSKRTWDFWCEDGQQAVTLAQLRMVRGWTDAELKAILRTGNLRRELEAL